MKRMIKYLILFIVAAAFAEARDCADVSSVNEPFDISSVDSAEVSTYLSVADYDFSLPRQVSSAGMARVQGNTRRNDTVQRQNFEFVRAGKTVNPSIRYLVQKTSLNTFSSLTDPSFKLDYQGKLII